MTMKKGFFSLLQYFPNSDRDERMNVAVMLESPSYTYMGVKYLRNMDGRLRCFDPSVDPPMIRLMANELENTRKSTESRAPVADINHVFKEIEHSMTKPIQILDLKCFFEESYKTLWRITDPKPVFLPESQRFDERLELLYNQLVAPPNMSKVKVYDKQYVSTRTVDEMARRKVLIADAEPVRGLDFADNDFDGLSVRDREVFTETYWQFGSFDVSNVRETFDQMRLFMEKVRDVRAVSSKVETALLERQFTVVLQPPKLKKSPDHMRKFETALEKLGKEQIRAFEVDNATHYTNLAEALREGHSPWEVHGLNG